MTREEEIKQSALKYFDNFIPDVYGIGHGDIYEAFMAGVDWADKHPKSPWISVKDDLPCNHKELIDGNSTKSVLVIDHEGCVGLLKMKKKNNGIIGIEPWWQWEIPAVIYYWMPIPNLPKE